MLGAGAVALAAGCAHRKDRVASPISLIVPAPADSFASTFKGAVEKRRLVSSVTIGPQSMDLTTIARFAGSRRPDLLMLAGPGMVTAAAGSDATALLASTTPLARLAGDWLLIVAPRHSRFRDFQVLAATLIRDPASVRLAGRSAGGPDHVLYGLTARGLGADARLLRYSAFPDTANVITALLDGRFMAGIGGYRDLIPHLGKLRVLAVSAPERVRGVDAPTLMESGASLTYADWRGLVAPGALREEDRSRLYDLCANLDGSAAWHAGCEREHWTPMYLAGGDFARWLSIEAQRAHEVLADLGVLRGLD